MKQQQLPVEIEKAPLRRPDCEVGVLQLTMITDSCGCIIFHRPLAEHSLAFLDSSRSVTAEH